MLPRSRCPALISLLLAACTTASSGSGGTDSGSTTGDDPTTHGPASTGSTRADEADTGEATTADDTTGEGSVGSSAESSTTGAATPLPEDLATELSDAWACDDLLVHLANPERTIMLTFTWPGRLAIAEKSGAEVTYEVSFNGKDFRDIELMIEQGSNLDSSTCQPTRGELAVVEDTWNVSGGYTLITAWPAWLSPAGTSGMADVTFTSIEVTRSSDELTFSVPDFEREGILAFP